MAKSLEVLNPDLREVLSFERLRSPLPIAVSKPPSLLTQLKRSAGNILDAVLYKDSPFYKVNISKVELLPGPLF